MWLRGWSLRAVLAGLEGHGCILLKFYVPLALPILYFFFLYFSLVIDHCFYQRTLSYPVPTTSPGPERGAVWCPPG